MAVRKTNLHSGSVAKPKENKKKKEKKEKKNQKKLENRGFDPRTSPMLRGRSTN